MIAKWALTADVAPPSALRAAEGVSQSRQGRSFAIDGSWSTTSSVAYSNTPVTRVDCERLILSGVSSVTVFQGKSSK